MADKITVESLQAEIETMKADSKKATDALIAQNELLTADSDKLKAKLTEANKHKTKQETDARKAVEEAARASGDIDAIKESYESELAKKDAAYNKVIDDWGHSEIANKSINMASSITMEGLDGLISPLIEKRFSYEYNGESMNINILDSDGKISIKSDDDLKNEFIENKDYERIIRGSSASGNGAAGNNGAKGARSISREEFNKMSPMSQGVYMSEKGTVHD